MLVAALASPLQTTLAQSAAAASPAPGPDLPVRLPALGESAAEDFTVGTERKLGDQIMGEIRRDPDFLDDGVLGEYLDSLWQPLVAAARQRGDIDTDVGTQFAWEAFLVRDRSVNAFALPGGFVGVHLGLISMTVTRDELASVLAHELTHITQRHIARGIAAQSRQTLLSMAAMILALLAASRSSNPDMAQAAIVGGQAAMIQGQLNFSRDMEREADRIGFAVLNAAGYAPGGMVGMFEKLDGASRLNDSGSYPYLRSHPLTFERQSEARLRLHGLPGAPVPGASSASPWMHALMAARSRVLMDPSALSLRRLQDTPSLRMGQGAVEQLAGLYTAALASSLLRDPVTAERRGQEARALLAAQASPDPAALRALWLLDAEGRMAAGDHAGALRMLAQVRERWPAAAEARPVLLMQAQAALHLQGSARTDALRASTEALQTWVAEHPRDGQAWVLLGNNADALGQKLRSLRAHAESRLLLGDLPGAIDRLRSGRNLVRSGVAGQDFIEVSIIDARLRELEAQRRQLLAEQRGRGGQRGGGREGGRDGNPDDRAGDTPARDDSTTPPASPPSTGNGKPAPLGWRPGIQAFSTSAR